MKSEKAGRKSSMLEKDQERMPKDRGSRNKKPKAFIDALIFITEQTRVVGEQKLVVKKDWQEKQFNLQSKKLDFRREESNLKFELQIARLKASHYDCPVHNIIRRANTYGLPCTIWFEFQSGRGCLASLEILTSVWYCEAILLKYLHRCVICDRCFMCRGKLCK